MIPNSIFTYEYNQPEDYRFSLDSVFLAQKVAEDLKKNEKNGPLTALDLCAGCGVIGMELHFHYPHIKKFDFIEVQNLYQPYFSQNIAQVKNSETSFHFLNLNYSELLSYDEYKNKYDLIVSNPPYFFIGEGILSPNEFKNRCRFFIDSDFNTLIKSIIHALKTNAHAYILVRSGNHHGRNIIDFIQDIVRESADVAIFDEIRGTLVVKLTKKSIEV